MADPRLERYDVDPAGNVMPPGMLWRNGVYYVRVMRGGQRRRKSTGKRDFKAALKRYHEIMKDWNDGRTESVEKVPTLQNYWENDYRPAWTVGKKTPLVNGRKYEYRDDSLMVSILDALGSYRLDALTATRIQKWANARRQETYRRRADGPLYTISEGTVTRELNLLQAVLQKAVDDGLLERNPARSIERNAWETRTRVVTLEEQAKLEAVLTPRFRRWFLFMLGTGLRLEEARTIREAEDLNFPGRSVRVTRKSRGLKKKIQDVPLIDPVLLDLLQEQLVEEGELWHQDPAWLRRVLARASEAVGIDPVTPHTLRHTFATRYLRSGGDIYVLSQILGHGSVSITEKVYAHLLTSDLLARSRGINLGLSAGQDAGGKVVDFPRRAGGAR